MRFADTLVATCVVLLSSSAIAWADSGASDAPGDPVVAAPATSSFFAMAEVFAAYRIAFTEADDFNEFEIDRAEFGAGFDKVGLGGLLLNMEVVRSASGESLLGIDTNSQVARLKHAYLYADPELGPGVVVARMGLIQDVWIAALQQGYELRGVRPLLAERSAFFDTSDLGLTLGYDLWDGRVSVRWQFSNGEGRNQTEQNPGKNSTVVASARLLEVPFVGGPLTVGLHGLYRDGSLGVAVARNHRYGGGLTAVHPRFTAGAEYVVADGTHDRADVDASILGVWASGRILDPWLGVFAAFDRHVMDADVDGADMQIISAGLFSDLVTWNARVGQVHLADHRGEPLHRLRLNLGYERWSFGDSAGAVAGIPEASNQDRIMLNVEARGLAHLF